MAKYIFSWPAQLKNGQFFRNWPWKIQSGNPDLSNPPDHQAQAQQHTTRSRRGQRAQSVTTETLRQYWNKRHWGKKSHSIECKLTLFVAQTFQDFAKMTLTQVSSHWLWLESSHSVKNVTRVELESPSFSTWLESSQSHEKLWLESSRVIHSSHAIPG